MNLLVIIPAYEPAWAAGGTVTATANLCRALAKQGVDITVYTTDVDGKGGHLKVPISKVVDVGGVKVWYFRCNVGKYGFYSKGLALKFEDTAGDFDLVHMSAIWQWMQVDVSRICMARDIPYIVSPHGSLNLWAWSQKSFKKKVYWELFGKRTLLNASAIHFTCKNEREQTFLQLPELKIIPSFVIPNGIEIRAEWSVLNIRDKLNIHCDKFVILYMGRIHRKKGLHLVVEAMKKVCDKRLMLLLVGHKEDMSYCAKLEEIGVDIREQIKWIGQVPANEVWDYYYASDLFVLSSHDENFGMVVVEAMSCGLPVMISNNVGIWEEIEEDNAGFVINQNIDEITGVLKKILQTPDLLKPLSKNAITSAGTRYGINNTTVLMRKAYSDILTDTRIKGVQWG